MSTGVCLPDDRAGGRGAPRRTRRIFGAATLVALLAIASCASEQKPEVAPPARVSGKSAEKPAAKPVAGDSRTSKPMSSQPSKQASANAKAPAGSPRAAPERIEPPATAKQQSKAGVGLPPPTYAEVVKEYNARTSRLQRVWARAVVSVEYTDDEGVRRSEQGEGHFQVIQPSRMALSAGKLSEVMLWIGCDAERYWFIDAKEKHRAWVGKHGSATRQKIESLGMPAAPRELLALAGITPLPKPGSDKRRDPIVRWSEDRRALIFDSTRAGARWRYFINPKTYEPSRIEVIDSDTSEPILSATLEKYDNLTIRGDGSLPPRIATRFRCLHHPSGSTLGLSIADMTDGGANRLRDPNFDFDALHELLGIREVVDLDAPRPAAANNDSDLE